MDISTTQYNDLNSYQCPTVYLVKNLVRFMILDDVMKGGHKEIKHSKLFSWIISEALTSIFRDT